MELDQYYRDVLKPRYEKNIEVARKVFGLDVVGYAYVSYDDGCSMILEPGAYDWVREQHLSPVYVDSATERATPRRKVLGRDVDAMEEVPDYFGNIQDAWLIIRKFVDQDKWDFKLVCDDGDEWFCHLGGSDRCIGKGKTVEEAICNAALNCMSQR